MNDIDIDNLVGGSNEPNNEPNNPAKPEEDITQRLQELERAKNGLYRSLKKERESKRELAQRLEEIRNYLYTVSQNKPQQPQAPPHIPVDFDQNDNPVVPATEVVRLAQEVVKQNVKPLQEELEATKHQLVQSEEETLVNKQIKSVLAEDENYPKAFEELNKQWGWVSKTFTNWLTDNNIKPRSPKEALDLLYTSPIRDAFQKTFPQADMDALIDAYSADTLGVMKVKLRKALSKATGTKKGDIDPEVLNTLANQSGFSGAAGVGNIKTPDITDLSDEELLKSVFE